MNYLEPRPMTVSEFPESTADARGVQMIDADPTPRYGTALLGIPYAEKSGQTLTLQLLLPPMVPDSTELFPRVLFVQGSAWFARATESHIDAGRMAMWGDSSGGHTTVLTYLTQDDPTFSDEPVTEPLGLRCCVDFYGPTDISAMNEEPSTMDHVGPDSPEGMLIGGRHVLDHPAAVAPTAAMNHVPTDRVLPPLLMIHGSKDRLVPFAQSVLLYEALVLAGQPVELYRLQGADHGGAPFWQPAVMDLVDGFLRRHLTASPAGADVWIAPERAPKDPDTR